MRYKQKIKRALEAFHLLVHVLIGVTAAIIFYEISGNALLIKLMVVAIIGSVLPDIDHLLYYFVYGRKTEYALQVKNFLRNKQIKKYVSFCIDNHKKNTGLYSHNIISVLITLSISLWAINQEREYTTMFFIAWSLHYIFDIFEDVIFLKKLNPNWLLKFSKDSENLKL